MGKGSLPTFYIHFRERNPFYTDLCLNSFSDGNLTALQNHHSNSQVLLIINSPLF